MRSIDKIYRYGGEEIVILLEGCSKKDAYIIAEKLRMNISKLNNDQYPAVTISIGISGFPEDSKQIDKVIHMFDQALLTAKRLGKNRTVIYND